MWGDIQDIFLFGCPKTIDITGFFKKFCIATRTMCLHHQHSAGGVIFLPAKALCLAGGVAPPKSVRCDHRAKRTAKGRMALGRGRRKRATPPVCRPQGRRVKKSRCASTRPPPPAPYEGGSIPRLCRWGWPVARKTRSAKPPSSSLEISRHSSFFDKFLLHC